MPEVRDYALSLYGREGVPAACLLLQDRLGLDVNLLLFAAFMGRTRGRAMTAADVAAAEARVAAWHAEVVRPLRAVRRRLKSGPAPAPSEATAALRARLQDLEIAAELIELDELDAMAGTRSTGRAEPMPAMMAGMTAVAEAAAGRAVVAEERAAIAAIARAAMAA